MVGNGAREHALAHVMARTAEVVVTPGNPGIAAAGLRCVAGDPFDLARSEAVDLVVIGPEQPLVDGLADRLRATGILAFGPGADGAQLEGSKAYLKELVHAADVPTAASRAFGANDVDGALAFLRSLDAPWVIKTDGLAAGKGVLVTNDLAEAEADVREKLSGAAFGAAGTTVVIEEGMTGPELSVLVVCDGRLSAEGCVVLPPARDHKRIGDGDTGPNTGGMGAFTPVPGVDADLEDFVVRRMVLPTLHELDRRGIEYRGVLYAGLMLTPTGPQLVEYNIRFGDPEAEVVLPRIDGDLAGFLASAAAGHVEPGLISISDDACCGIVLAAPGYPAAPQLGGAISGIDAASARPGITVFSAAVDAGGDGLITAGGRVLCVTARAPTAAAARDAAYAAADDIDFVGGVLRRGDIASSA